MNNIKKISGNSSLIIYKLLPDIFYQWWNRYL